MSAPESAAAAGLAALDDIGMPTETVARVGTAFETWNTLDSDGSVAGLVSYVLNAVPGFAETLGALGECAPLVGIVFAFLKVAGKHVADVAETKVAYEEFARAVITTTLSLVRVVTEYSVKGVALPGPVQIALDQFWAQLKEFAKLLVGFRGSSYAKRLFAKGTHRAQLREVQTAIGQALQNLHQAGILTAVLQNLEIQTNQMDAARQVDGMSVKLEVMSEQQAESAQKVDKVIKQQKTLSSKQDKALASQVASSEKLDTTLAKLDTGLAMHEATAKVLGTATTMLEQVIETQKKHAEGTAASSSPQQPGRRNEPAQVWNIATLMSTPTFVGRTVELAALNDVLYPATVKGTSKRIVISGMGGTGKSTLAHQAAVACAARFTRGWSVDGSSESALASGLALVAHDLELGERKPNEIAAAVQSRLSEPDVTGWVMIVDNVDDVVFKAALLEWLPKVGGCLLITSRLTDWEGWARIELGKLSAAEATQLLGGSAADAPSIAAVVKQLDGLAVALEQARAYVRRVKIPWAKYVDRLAAQASKDVLPSLQLSLMAALEQNPAVATLLQLLQVLHPDDIPRDLVTQMMEKIVPGVDADELLALLGGFSIVTFTTQTASLHRLMQEAMRAVAPCTSATVSALSEVMNELVEEKRRSDYPLMRSLLVQYEPVLAALERLSPGSAAVGAAWHAVGTIHTYSFYSDAAGRTALERALAVQEALFGPDDVSVAKTLRRLGLAVGGLGDAMRQKELTERALEINERHLGADHVEVAETLRNLGDAYCNLGDYAKGKSLLELALNIKKRHFGPEHPETAMTLTSLGNAYSSLGDEEEAKNLYERSLVITERYNGPDHPQVANVLANLGNAYGALGDAATKKTLLERALVIQEHHYGPDHPNVASTVFNIGAAHQALGNMAEARKCMERCLAIETAFYGADHPNTIYTIETIAKLPHTPV